MPVEPKITFAWYARVEQAFVSQALLMEQVDSTDLVSIKKPNGEVATIPSLVAKVTEALFVSKCDVTKMTRPSVVSAIMKVIVFKSIPLLPGPSLVQKPEDEKVETPKRVKKPKAPAEPKAEIEEPKPKPAEPKKVSLLKALPRFEDRSEFTRFLDGKVYVTEMTGQLLPFCYAQAVLTNLASAATYVEPFVKNDPSAHDIYECLKAIIDMIHTHQTLT